MNMNMGTHEFNMNMNLNLMNRFEYDHGSYECKYE